MLLRIVPGNVYTVAICCLRLQQPFTKIDNFILIRDLFTQIYKDLNIDNIKHRTCNKDLSKKNVWRAGDRGDNMAL